MNGERLLFIGIGVVLAYGVLRRLANPRVSFAYYAPHVDATAQPSHPALPGASADAKPHNVIAGRTAVSLPRAASHPSAPMLPIRGGGGVGHTV